jgi:hypothetical protein
MEVSFMATTRRKFRKGQVVLAKKDCSIFPLRYQGRRCTVVGYEGKNADGIPVYTVQVRERKEPIKDVWENELSSI